MRRIIVKEVRPGMIAARSIADPNAAAKPGMPAVTLAATADLLTLEHLMRFHELGIYDLWVNDPGLEFFDELCSTQPTIAQRRLADALRESFLRLSAWIPRSLFKRHDIILEETLLNVLRTAPVIPCFATFTEDEALLGHSCDVLAVSTILGLHLENYLIEQRRRLNCRQARDVVNLALGALFHDVGELMLPAEQRESRVSAAGMTSDDWKRHTDEGFAIVRGRLDPSAATVVLHHHQHFDGHGFAGPGEPTDAAHRPLAGQVIHVFARIVMAADLFCQSLYAGGSRLPQPLVRTLWEIQQVPQRHAFDPTIHQALMTMFSPFTEGTIVTLNDGRQALVTKIDAVYPCYPEVRIIRDLQEPPAGEPCTINLAERLDLAIDSVDGTSVEHYLYGQRKVHPLIAA